MAKKFPGESNTVAVFLSTGVNWIRKGKYRDFPSKIFCFTVPKSFVGESFNVSLISVIEKFYASEGYVTIFDFLSKFFFLTVPKIVAGEPFCAVFQKKTGSEKVYG